MFFQRLTNKHGHSYRKAVLMGYTAKFVGNSRLCNLGIHLYFEPVLHDNQIYIPENFQDVIEV